MVDYTNSMHMTKVAASPQFGFDPDYGYYSDMESDGDVIHLRGTVPSYISGTAIRDFKIILLYTIDADTTVDVEVSLGDAQDDDTVGWNRLNAHSESLDGDFDVIPILMLKTYGWYTMSPTGSWTSIVLKIERTDTDADDLHIHGAILKYRT